MQCTCEKNGNVHKMKKGRHVKIIWYPLNETVVLRMIYKSTLQCSSRLCGTGSSVKRSENCSRPIPSIGLGRQTTGGSYADGIPNDESNPWIFTIIVL